MWGVDKDNTVWYKEMTNPDLQMQRMVDLLLFQYSYNLIALFYPLNLNGYIMLDAFFVIFYSSLHPYYNGRFAGVFRLQVS